MVSISYSIINCGFFFKVNMGAVLAPYRLFTELSSFI